MRGFMLYVPNTRVKRGACYMSLALGLKGRIRRSDIRVFPRRVACYTSLALGLKGALCYMSLARGFKDRIRQSGIGVFSKKSCVLYVPSTRVKRCFVLYVPSSRVKKEL